MFDDDYVVSVLMYDAQTWTLTKQTTYKLEYRQRKMERLMLGITIKQKD